MLDVRISWLKRYWKMERIRAAEIKKMIIRGRLPVFSLMDTYLKNITATNEARKLRITR
jgi:hypothetical protein